VALDQLFGANRSELGDGTINGNHSAQVHTLLLLLDQIPDNLIDLPFNDYLEFSNCRGSLATSLARECRRYQPGATAPRTRPGGANSQHRRRLQQSHRPYRGRRLIRRDSRP
jgi:7-keto-8-aminopelargonate synthetase-like enzyme